MTTSLSSLLGTKYPLVQAPMAGVQDKSLLLAVCKAGGLGSLPAAMLSPSALAAELEQIVCATDAPFNVNFFCHREPDSQLDAQRQWIQQLSPYYREWNVAPPEPVSVASRRPFSVESLAVLQEYRPAVVSFHFGLPAPDHLATIRAWGGKVLACATTLDEALYLDAQSVDILVVQGLEAGGHRGHFLRDDLDGQLTSAELAAAVLPQVQVPVVVAGGIHCADQVAQYLAMGAAGVQVGTAFLRCPEATTSDVHRKALRAGSQSGTALTNLFSGRLARGLVNRLMRERGPLAQQLPDFPLASAALVSLRSAAESLGSGDFSPLWAGENYHFGEDISAEQVVAVLMDVPGARS